MCGMNGGSMKVFHLHCFLFLRNQASSNSWDSYFLHVGNPQ